MEGLETKCCGPDAVAAELRAVEAATAFTKISHPRNRRATFEASREAFCTRCGNRMTSHKRVTASAEKNQFTGSHGPERQGHTAQWPRVVEEISSAESRALRKIVIN